MIGKFAFPESRKRLKKYYKSVCGKCFAVCCSYNTSPICATLSLPYLMDFSDIVIFKKALEFNPSYKKKVKKNVQKSLKYLIKRGFALDFFDYLEENDYSAKSIVTIYRGISARINDFNKKMEKKGKYENKFDDCLLLIPGQGCIMEDYRPHICKLAFRACFKKLDLYDFVESHIREIKEEKMLKYLKKDFELSKDTYLPKIIIGPSEDCKFFAEEILAPEMKVCRFSSLTYLELADLADFLVSPLRKKASHTEPVQNLIDNFKGKRWEQYYTLSFVDKLVKGEKGDNFNFGMEWFDVFQIKR